MIFDQQQPTKNNLLAVHARLCESHQLNELMSNHSVNLTTNRKLNRSGSKDYLV